MQYWAIKDCTSATFLSVGLSGHYGKANLNDRIDKREMQKCGESFQEEHPNLKDRNQKRN